MISSFKKGKLYINYGADGGPEDGKTFDGGLRMFPLKRWLTGRINKSLIKHLPLGTAVLCVDETLNRFSPVNNAWTFYKFLYEDKIYIMEKCVAEHCLKEMK